MPHETPARQPGPRRPALLLPLSILASLGALACGEQGDEGARPAGETSVVMSAICGRGDADLVLPDGFCATVFADSLGPIRHAVVREDGALFVVRQSVAEGEDGVLVLRDTTGDGVSDVRESFAPEAGGTGIALLGSNLYVDGGGTILRYTVPAGAPLPRGPGVPVAVDLPRGGHDALTFVPDDRGGLLVNIGSLTNACQVADREPGSPGAEPCRELETRAGIWRFDSEATGQRQADGTPWATGIRNALALAIDGRGRLWAVQHGRDQLSTLWPGIYTDEQNAENPVEELLLVARGDDFGWPYCYYSREFGRKVLAPEYGGVGDGTVGRCSDVKSASAVFPAHWAPMDLLFYSGEAFPMRFRNGAFISFHGSWNRAPLDQQGFNVVFLPMSNGEPVAAYEIFAEGFTGAESLSDPSGAAHRPVGLAEGPTGELYVTDDRRGRIWRIEYRGEP